MILSERKVWRIGDAQNQSLLMQLHSGLGILCVLKDLPWKFDLPQSLLQRREVRGSWTSGQDLLGVKLPAEEKRAGSLSTFTSYGAGKWNEEFPDFLLLSFGQRPEAEAVAIMKPQNFLLENLKFANVEEFSKKRLKNCGYGRFFLRKYWKLWMWKKFSKKR